jgi:hypothetical protein
MVEHEIERCLTFNMDEKGFLIGGQNKSKRVISKPVWVRDGSRAAIQDGNREWVTIIPTNLRRWDNAFDVYHHAQ